MRIKAKFWDNIKGYNIDGCYRGQLTEQSIYPENNEFFGWEKIKYAIELR